jgi:hypothetical protein
VSDLVKRCKAFRARIEAVAALAQEAKADARDALVEAKKPRAK